MVVVDMTLNSGVRGRIFFLLFLSNYQELLSPLEETSLFCGLFTHQPRGGRFHHDPPATYGCPNSLLCEKRGLKCTSPVTSQAQGMPGDQNLGRHWRRGETWKLPRPHPFALGIIVPFSHTT